MKEAPTLSYVSTCFLRVGSPYLSLCFSPPSLSLLPPFLRVYFKYYVASRLFWNRHVGYVCTVFARGWIASLKGRRQRPYNVGSRHPQGVHPGTVERGSSWAEDRNGFGRWGQLVERRTRGKVLLYNGGGGGDDGSILSSRRLHLWKG